MVHEVLQKQCNMQWDSFPVHTMWYSLTLVKCSSFLCVSDIRKHKVLVEHYNATTQKFVVQHIREEDSKWPSGVSSQLPFVHPPFILPPATTIVLVAMATCVLGHLKLIIILSRVQKQSTENNFLHYAVWSHYSRCFFSVWGGALSLGGLICRHYFVQYFSVFCNGLSCVCIYFVHTRKLQQYQNMDDLSL